MSLLDELLQTPSAIPGLNYAACPVYSPSSPSYTAVAPVPLAPSNDILLYTFDDFTKLVAGKTDTTAGELSRELSNAQVALMPSREVVRALLEYLHKMGRLRKA